MKTIHSLSFFFVGVFVACIVLGASPLHVLAQATDDVGSGDTSTCPQISTTLSRGMRDAQTDGQVTELQSFLQEWFNLPDSFPSGYFGMQTRGYVIRFQQ